MAEPKTDIELPKMEAATVLPGEELPEEDQKLAKRIDAQTAIGTGNPEIDKKMGGGIPLRSLTLIEGQPDAGKSVLAQQMVWGAVQSGFRTTMFTTENSVQSLVRQMDSLGLDILDALLLDELRIFPIRLQEQKEDMKKALGSLLYKMKRQENRDLIVVDSLTPFLSHISSDAGMSFIEQCKTLCDRGRSIVLTIHSYACDEGIMVRMESMCDAHLRLTIEEMGDKLIKSLVVAKVRGASKVTGNIVAFEVEPKMGMRIIPFSRARA